MLSWCLHEEEVKALSFPRTIFISDVVHLIQFIQGKGVCSAVYTTDCNLWLVGCIWEQLLMFMLSFHFCLISYNLKVT